MSGTSLRLTMRFGGKEESLVEIVAECGGSVDAAAQVADDDEAVLDAAGDESGNAPQSRQRDPDSPVSKAKDGGTIEGDERRMSNIRGFESDWRGRLGDLRGLAGNLTNLGWSERFRDMPGGLT